MPANTDTPKPKKVTFEVKDRLKIVGDAYGSPDNPAVLFAHGGGQTRHAWGNTAALLAQRGWYAVAIDLRGHGDSSWHPQGDYRLDSFAEDIRLIASRFEKPPAYVGASLGGISGLIAQGESKLPVFSAMVFVDVAHRHEDKGSARIMDFMGEHLETGFANLEEVVESIAAYLPHRARPEDSSGVEKNLRLHPDGKYYWHWDPQFLKYVKSLKTSNQYHKRFADAATRLQIPVLLVRGKISDVLSLDAAMEFLELVPQAKFADVQDAAHMVAGDRNDLFSDSVINFLCEEFFKRSDQG